MRVVTALPGLQDAGFFDRLRNRRNASCEGHGDYRSERKERFDDGDHDRKKAREREKKIILIPRGNVFF